MLQPITALARMAILLASGIVLAGSTVSARADEVLKGRIVYSQKEGDRMLLHIMKADGTEDHVIPNQLANINVFPMWSPDGKHIAFVTGREFKNEPDQSGFQIATINPDGTGLKTLPLTFQFALFPCWSPSGKQLAFTAGERDPNVFVSDADGGNLRQVNPQDRGGFLAFWVDEKTLGYTNFSKTGPKGEITLAKLDGTGEQAVTQNEKISVAGGGAISPDAKQLLLVVVDPSTDTGSMRLWDFSSKSETMLPDVKIGSIRRPHDFPTPSWSPDGKTFLVTIAEENGSGVFRYTADGKTSTRITPKDAVCFGASWTGTE